jgi:hypothetical protein
MANVPLSNVRSIQTSSHLDDVGKDAHASLPKRAALSAGSIKNAPD